VADLAFYCVCDREHFIGLVALVNSLRLLGHDEPVYVLDCGFEDWQRAALEHDEGILVRKRPLDWHPMLLKTVLPLTEPAAVMAVVDVDIIFTQRLDPLVDLARRTEKPVLFPDLWSDRFFGSWEELGFGPPVPHPCAASGQFVLPARSGRVFLEQWATGLERFAANPTLSDPTLDPLTNPFRFLDMDVLNALIGTVIELDAFEFAGVDTASYPPFEGVAVADAQRLRLTTTAHAKPPILLHHFLGKPWNHLVAPNVYSRLLMRLLTGSGLSVRMPKRHIPFSLRYGVRGFFARRYVVSRLWVRARRSRLRARRVALRSLAADGSSGRL